MGQTEQKLGLKMKAAGGGEKVEEKTWHDIIISNIRRMLDERGIRQTKVAEKLSVSKYAFQQHAIRPKNYSGGVHPHHRPGVGLHLQRYFPRAERRRKAAQ